MKFLIKQAAKISVFWKTSHRNHCGKVNILRNLGMELKSWRICLSLHYLLIIIFIQVDNANTQQSPANTAPKNNDAFKLPVNYTKEHRPSNGGETTYLTCNVHVQAINPIKAADMDFRMDMTLTLRWTDDRLQFAEQWFDNKENLILPLEFVDQIWQPHPFVVNAKSTDVGQLTQKLVSVYIFRNHTVQYSVNVFATVACAMNYRFYPFDSQLCPMFLESFSFDETQVKLAWAKWDAFTINPQLRMLQFEPRRPLLYSMASVSRYNEVKNFSQLIAYFRFDRLLGNHLIQTFAPCSLVVCLSWFSFWLELNALSARMSLLVTSILTLVTQFVGLKTDLPPVAYVKAVDIWMAGCMIWVFGALGEFVVAKVIYSLTEDAKFRYHEDRMKLFNPSGSSPKHDFATPLKNNRNGARDMDDTALKTNPEVLAEGQAIGQTGVGDFNTQRLRHRRLISLDEKESFDAAETKSIATTGSASLDKNLGRMKVPLQWIHPKTGKQVLLWKKIDNISKWTFPLSFLIFCTIYWIVLYIHSKVDNDLDKFVVSTNVSESA